MQSAYVQKLAEFYPNPPCVLILENNEATETGIGTLRTRLETKDSWNRWNFTVKSDADLRTVSWRAANYVLANGITDGYVLEAKVNLGFRDLFGATTAAIKSYTPWPGVTYTGCYHGTGYYFKSNDDYTYSYLQPNETWPDGPGEYQPYAFDVTSGRVYQSTTTEMDNSLYGHPILQCSEVWSHTLPGMPVQPLREWSLWIDPSRITNAYRSGDGTITLERAKAWLRQIIWQCNAAGKTTSYRWFTGSSEKLTDLFLNQNNPPEPPDPVLRATTEQQWWDLVTAVITEIHTNATLKTAWLTGTLTVNPAFDHFVTWELPEGVSNNRSFHWYTSADDETLWDLENPTTVTVNVWTMVVTVGSNYLLYVWSATGDYVDVIVDYPGGTVTVDVPQSGAYYWIASGVPTLVVI